MADRSRAISLWEKRMSTLSKRATPLQLQMLRIIEGAVKNTFDAHPLYLIGMDEYPFDKDRFARSVAKRAVGTLSAQYDLSVLWTENIRADVLAEAVSPSEQAG